MADAIEKDRAETTVASAGVRVLVGVDVLAPVLIGRIARLAGVGRVRDAMLDAAKPAR